MATTDIFKQRLEEGLKILNITVEGSGLDRALEFLYFLMTKTQMVNLTAIRNPEEAVEKHLIDSLALLPVLDRLPISADTSLGGQVSGQMKNMRGALLDVGTGGGLPGIPLKCARPDIRVSLIEAKAKKVKFLKDALQKLNLKAIKAYQHFLDPECPVDFLGRYDWIVTRASMPIVDYVRSAILYKKEEGSILLMKGPNADNELEESIGQIQRLGLNLAHRIPFKLPFSEADRVIIVLR